MSTKWFQMALHERIAEILHKDKEKTSFHYVKQYNRVLMDHMHDCNVVLNFV